MPRIITQYECEICHTKYDSFEQALRCEAQKVKEALPKGLVFNNAGDPNAFYKNITFAIAESIPEGHYRNDKLWACRDNEFGDTLGSERCSNGGAIILTKEDRADPNHPTFHRMVRWLQSQQIPVTVWDGEKIVLLDEFLRQTGAQLA